LSHQNDVTTCALRVLVPEAHAMGSVACIRSLGRAGHTVIAASDQVDALGFRSNYCSRSVLQPKDLSLATYAAWLSAVVRDNDIDLVIPSETLVGMLGQRIDDFAGLLPCGPDPRRLERFIGKFELFSAFLEGQDASLRANLSGTLLLRRGDDIHARLATLTPPIFVKFDAVQARGLPASVLRFDSCEAAQEALPPMLDRYERAVAQQFAPGAGVGVFFLRWNGEVKATLMHRRLHEVPHTGGVSSLRESWWNERVHEDALKRIEALEWWGVGMLEYRWDASTGNFALMEFNARFWGSLHLALFAGVDFPRLLVDAWAGRAIESVRASVGVRCRYTFPKEVEHLWSLLRDSKVHAHTKLNAVLEFIMLSFSPGVHSDLWFPRDRGLYFRALAATPGKFLRRS